MLGICMYNARSGFRRAGVVARGVIVRAASGADVSREEWKKINVTAQNEPIEGAVGPAALRLRKRSRADWFAKPQAAGSTAVAFLEQRCRSLTDSRFAVRTHCQSGGKIEWISTGTGAVCRT